MDDLDYWRLSDQLSVIDAALLIAGENPSSCRELVEQWEAHNRPAKYVAARTAIQNAIEAEILPARIVHGGEYFESCDSDMFGKSDWVRQTKIDLFQTTVKVSDLKNWLFEKGIKTGFFFSKDVDEADYLNPKHPCYAPKLAAAVEAWKAVSSDPGLYKNRSPKKALEKWIKENAARYQFTDDNGNPQEQPIEDISKVANWNIKGGAPKTGG